MPLERFSESDPIRWDKGDWFNTSACASFSATPLQIVASAGAGNIHYISSLTFSSPSAQLISIFDGTSATITKIYTTALGNNQITFPRGMELRNPTVGQNIKASSDVSAMTYFTIAGFYKPYEAA